MSEPKQAGGERGFRTGADGLRFQLEVAIRLHARLTTERDAALARAEKAEACFVLAEVERKAERVRTQAALARNRALEEGLMEAAARLMAAAECLNGCYAPHVAAEGFRRAAIQARALVILKPLGSE